MARDRNTAPSPIPPGPNRVEEIQHGRNFIRKGDLLKVSPKEGSPPGSHGFKARFWYADIDKGGLFYTVIRQEKNDKGILVGCGFHSVKPERVTRTATTHDPQQEVQKRKEAKRNAKQAP